MSDDRRGLPSVSSLERLANCPDAFQASNGMPSTTSPDAEAGTRIHHALAQFYLGLQAPERLLEDEELRTAEACINLLSALIRDTFPDETRKVALVEKRLWLDGLGSGQLDIVLMLPTAYLIVEWKSGRLQTTPAETNWQLRGQVGVFRQTLGDDQSDIYAAVVAPWQSPTTTLVKYGYQESLEALQATKDVFQRAMQRGLPRKAGEWCKYCPALGNCQEAHANAVLTVHAASPITVSHEAHLALMPGPQLADFLKCVPRMENVIEAAKAEAKRRLDADPESLPGYRLKPGAWKDTITKPEEVFRRFVAKGGTSESFLPTVSVAKGKLSDALKAITGLKGEALENALDDLLAGATESKQNAPSLEKVKS